LTARVPTLFVSPTALGFIVYSRHGGFRFGFFPLERFLPFAYQVLVFASACL